MAANAPLAEAALPSAPLAGPPALPAQQACPHCASPVTPGWHFCPSCEAPLSAAAAQAADAIARAERLESAATLSAAPPFAASAPVAMPGPTLPCPIELHFDAARQYRQGECGIFRFRLRNAGAGVVKQPEIELSAASLPAPKRVSSPLNLAPGQQAQLDVTDFLPRQPGEDVVRVRLSFASEADEDCFFTGTLDVRVLPPQQPAHVNVNFQADGPMVVDAEKMVNVPAQDTPPPPSAPVWLPVALMEDVERRRRIGEYFPAPVVTEEQAGLAHLAAPVVATSAAPVQPAPCLTIDGGDRYFIVAGDKMLLGRNRSVCHAALRVYPENALNHRANMAISGQHLAVAISGEKAFLLDTSTYGTDLAGRRLGKGVRKRLWDGAEIDIVHVLKLRARLFTDGQGIAAVLLERIGNQPQDRYLLVRSFAVLGSGAGAAIALPGAAQGAVLFLDPADRAWKLRSLSEGGGPFSDIALAPGQQVSWASHVLCLT